MTLPDPSIPEDPDSTDAKNLTCKMDHLARLLQKFWKRWKKEYLLELREFHHMRLDKGTAHTLEKGEIVTIYDEGHLRGLWKLGRIEG